VTVGLDPIHDARPPICHQEAAAPVDEQRQRMLEAGREGDNTARTTVRLQLDADDAPAEAAAVVLPPLGGEEDAPVSPREALAGVEGESVSRGVRLEISRRRRDRTAATGKAQGAGVCPTVRPPIARTTLDED